jgi:hypothetical protein
MGAWNDQSTHGANRRDRRPRGVRLRLRRRSSHSIDRTGRGARQHGEHLPVTVAGYQPAARKPDALSPSSSPPPSPLLPVSGGFTIKKAVRQSSRPRRTPTGQAASGEGRHQDRGRAARALDNSDHRRPVSACLGSDADRGGRDGRGAAARAQGAGDRIMTACVHSASVPALRGPHPAANRSVLAGQAEGVGFEPTRSVTQPSGFQDRRHRPLGEPSCVDQPYASGAVRVIREIGLRGTAKPSPTVAARVRYASAVSELSSSSSTSAPSSR